MPLCPMCRNGLRGSCLGGTCSDSIPTTPTQVITGSLQSHDTTQSEPTELRGSSTRQSSRSGNRGRDSNLKDQQSTGRKRAAKQYPLDRDGPCEWRNLACCGGGTYSIQGCISGLQQARHHGPDKSVVNNEQGNVHRICHYCHNRWHAKNDKGYDWNKTNYPVHAPRPMTPEETQAAVLDEMRYLGSAQAKTKVKD